MLELENPVMCMFAIHHKHYDTFKQIFFTYKVGRYIISKEISKTAHKQTDGEHFHLLFEDINNQYHNFSKTVKEKFNLNGLARNGMPKQYGKEKVIRDLERSVIYTLKDGLYESTIEKDVLEYYFEQSFKKKEKIVKELNEHLEELFKDDELEELDLTLTKNKNFQGSVYTVYINKLKQEIILYHVVTGNTLGSRNIIDGYIRYYLTHTKNLSISQKCSILSYFLYNHI